MAGTPASEMQGTMVAGPRKSTHHVTCQMNLSLICRIGFSWERRQWQIVSGRRYSDSNISVYWLSPLKLSPKRHDISRPKLIMIGVVESSPPKKMQCKNRYYGIISCPLHSSFALFLDVTSRSENNGFVSSGSSTPIFCACCCTSSNFTRPRTHRRAEALAATARLIKASQFCGSDRFVNRARRAVQIEGTLETGIRSMPHEDRWMRMRWDILRAKNRFDEWGSG